MFSISFWRLDTFETMDCEPESRQFGDHSAGQKKSRRQDVNITPTVYFHDQIQTKRTSK